MDQRKIRGNCLYNKIRKWAPVWSLRQNLRREALEIIADNLSKAGWSWGCVSGSGFQRPNDLDCGRTP